MKKVKFNLITLFFNVLFLLFLSNLNAQDITTGLLGNWTFSGDADDESGNNYNGTVNGASLTNDRDGIASSAYSFNGVSDNITTNLSLSGYSGISFSVWVNASVLNTSQKIISQESNSGTIERDAYLGIINNSVYFYVKNNSDYKFIYTGPNIVINTWYHIVGTWDANDMKIFIDGQEQTVTSASNGFITSIGSQTSSTIKFGNEYDNSAFFNGIIDDIRIYSRELTTADVTELNNLTPNTGSSLWYQTGNDISYQEGNVGIGMYSGTSALSVAGQQEWYMGTDSRVKLWESADKVYFTASNNALNSPKPLILQSSSLEFQGDLLNNINIKHNDTPSLKLTDTDFNGSEESWEIVNELYAGYNTLSFQHDASDVNSSALRLFKDGTVGMYGSHFMLYNNTEKVFEITETDMKMDGKITATEIEVKTDVWADFVFAEDYNLKPLTEVKEFINENKHLPDVPSENEVKENGVNIGEMNALLLQKIEELTLYMIELEEQVKDLQESK